MIIGPLYCRVSKTEGGNICSLTRNDKQTLNGPLSGFYFECKLTVTVESFSEENLEKEKNKLCIMVLVLALTTIIFFFRN